MIMLFHIHPGFWNNFYVRKGYSLATPTNSPELPRCDFVLISKLKKNSTFYCVISVVVSDFSTIWYFWETYLPGKFQNVKWNGGLQYCSNDFDSIYSSDETAKTEALCHTWCGTIKIPSCVINAYGVDQKPEFWKFSVSIPKKRNIGTIATCKQKV